MAELPLVPQKRLGADDLAVLLRKRYPAEEYALLFEVRNATGFSANRSADAIGVSLWPSRGLEIEGFEFKVSRQDWLKELRTPEKAESIARFCDRWWLVVSEEKIVAPGELPPNWGLMVPHRDGLKAAIPASKLAPEPLNIKFVAAVCRAAQNASPQKTAVEAAVSAARQEWDKHADIIRKRDREHITAELADLRRAVADFETASGISISGWSAGRVGKAVQAFLDGRLHLARDIDSARASLGRTMETLTELMNAAAIKQPIVEKGDA